MDVFVGNYELGDYPWSPGEVALVGRIETGGMKAVTGDGYVNALSGRFTGASVAGLVVGAMGVLVVTVALRHWLGERRKFREEARAYQLAPHLFVLVRGRPCTSGTFTCPATFKAEGVSPRSAR